MRMVLAVVTLVGLAACACEKRTTTKCTPGSYAGSADTSGAQFAHKCSAGGTWEMDREATDQMNKRVAELQNQKDDLYWALRTRVLTDEEMGLVKELGTGLITRPGVAYQDRQVSEQLNSALLLQFKIRKAASQ